MRRATARRLVVYAGCVALCVLLVSACRSESAPDAYVARVGDHYLTQAELNERLQGLQVSPDTSAARQQVVEQWVNRMLLLQAAEQRNLARDSSVQERLETQRQSVLVNALTERLYDEAEVTVTEPEIRSYYERHRDQMRLREPLVRIRYLTTPDETAAYNARVALRQADPEADSVWTRVAREYAQRPRTALEQAQGYRPERDVFPDRSFLRRRLESMNDGELVVLRPDTLYHVLQLVDRTEAGSIPPLAWVEDQIRQRLRVRARKQTYAREVQRLRNEAQTQGRLEVR
jgi:hypothetical protein